MRHVKTTALILSLAFLAACAGVATRAWVQDNLYFGLSSPSGPLSAEEWQGFVDHTVTPLFPEGLTIIPASGQWRGGNRAILREDSRILQIVHPDTPQADAKINSICAVYKAWFKQQSVLRVKTKVDISL
jgi:hypothetical protein